MKTAEEILENELNNIGFSFADQLKPDNISFTEVKKVKKAILNAMESYATERESKYRELVGAQRDLIKLYGYCLSDHAVFLAIHGVKETEGNIELGKMMRKRITEFEKELGLDKCS